MKYLIALLTAATGILHLLVGFNVIPGSGQATTAWLLVLNGVGYLVLLVLYWTASGNRGTIRWILLAYTLITLVGYFIIGAGLSGGTIPLVIKAIELLLIILLFLDRGSDRVAAPAAATTSRTGGVSTSGVPSSTTTTSRTVASDTSATLSGMAGTAAAGVSTAAAGAAVAAGSLYDRAEDTADQMADTTGDTMDEAADMTGDSMDYAGDRVGDAYDATVDMAGDAVDATGDAMQDAGAAMAATAGAAVDEVQDTFDAGTAAEMDAAQMAAEPTADELRAELENYLRGFGPSSEFRKEIEYIEGIGPAFGQKLRAVGIATVLDLMVNGATRRGRKQISDQSGIAQSQILTWVNHIDLFRIKGVAQEYADLLEQAGVDTVVELAQRNPANLHKRMLDVNEQKALVRRAPHASDVQSWVEQAKSLRRLVHY
jgi:predicted flap endonuclease-1-like 5' DNA nuclease